MNKYILQNKRLEYKNIKNRMAELRKEYRFLMENMDITGGARGMRNNNRQYNRVAEIKRELMRLNKKLLKTPNK